MLMIKTKKLRGKQNKGNQRCAHNPNSRLVWDTVNEVTRRKGPKRGRIKASSTDERLAIWKDYFQKLLGQSPEIDDQPVPKVFDTPN